MARPVVSADVLPDLMAESELANRSVVSLYVCVYCREQVELIDPADWPGERGHENLLVSIWSHVSDNTPVCMPE